MPYGHIPPPPLLPDGEEDLPLPPTRTSSSGGTGGRELTGAGQAGAGRSGHKGKRSRHSGTGHSTSHHENPATTSRSGNRSGGGGTGKCSTVPPLISTCVSVLQFAPQMLNTQKNVPFHLKFHFNLQF